jgi:hypothetical protein
MPEQYPKLSHGHFHPYPFSSSFINRLIINLLDIIHPPVFYPVSETLFLIKTWTMDNVQKVNYFTNEPSSQTFRFYLHSRCGSGILRFKTQLAKTSNNHDIVPKALTLKAPYHNHRSSKIILRARKALPKDRIQF